MRGEQRRAGLGENIERGDGAGVELPAANHRREHGDIGSSLRWHGSAGRQMLVVAKRAGVVRGEEAGRAVPIEHLAKISGARENVVARIVALGPSRCRARNSVYVFGMICISPIAPTGEMARGSPPLSMRVTARIQCAGRPNLCEASADVCLGRKRGALDRCPRTSRRARDEHGARRQMEGRRARCRRPIASNRYSEPTDSPRRRGDALRADRAVGAHIEELDSARFVGRRHDHVSDLRSELVPRR